MRWNIHNILGGAASVQLFAPRQDYREVLAAIALRVTQEDVPAEQVLTHFMRERMLGQALMTGSCLGLLGLALVGATSQWPTPLVALAAIGPTLLMMAVPAVHARVCEKA